MLEWFAFILLLLGVLGVCYAALKHLPEWQEKVLEAEILFGILGLLFAFVLLAFGEEIHLPWGEIVTVTIVTTVGCVASFVLVRAGVISRITKALPDPLLAFIAVGIVPVTGSLLGEPGAIIVTSVLIFEVAANLHGDNARYQVLSSVFASIAVGGLLSVFAAPPVAVAASEWPITTGVLWKYFAPPKIVAMMLQGLYSAWVVKKHHVKGEFKEFQLKFEDVMLIGPKTGFFLLGVILLAHFSASVVGPFLFEGSNLEIYIKLGIATNAIDNAGLAESGVSFLHDPTMAQMYFALSALLAFACGTIIANAPNVISAMLLGPLFSEHRVNFVQQAKNSLVPLTINALVFAIWGIYIFGI